MMEPFDYLIRFGVALGIGFMVGLQREFAFRDSRRALIAGERTLALMGLAGALAAFIADILGAPLVFVGILIMIGVFTAIAYFIDAWHGQVGLTTEITILIVVMTGALCYWDHITLAVAIGITTTVLLSLKLETDRLVKAMTREDILAALQLAVISAIILPVLPNESLWPPPFDVLNPFNIWLMVVFITGFNFLGYLSIKIVGPEQGIGLTGLLGGLVSSTGVTLSFSERSHREPRLARAFALAITVAWAVMFARVLVEVGVLNLPLLRVIWLPIAASGAVGLLFGAYLFRLQRATEKGMIEFSNPFDLSSAIKFGILYAVILLVARAAQMYFGDTGVLISAILSGFADVDAITLSLSELNRAGGLEIRIAAQAIILAAMSNTAAKGAIVMIGGAPAIRRVVLPGLILILVTGVVTALLVI
jgi:uncharacterized membrane protein (DUF4010 family)